MIMPDTLLTNEEIARFRKDGYVAPIRVFTEEEVHVLANAVNEHLTGSLNSECYELTDKIRIRNVAGDGERPIYEYESDGGEARFHTFPFLFNLWKVDDRFARVARKDTLVRMARQLLAVDEVLLFEDNVVIKAPFSKYLPWHQDYSYWPLGEPTALTVWIALDDIDSLNGAMEIAPGTQRLGERLPVAFGDGSAFMRAERPGIPEVPADPRSLGYEVHAYKLKAGEGGIHDGMVWHGSTPNSSAQIRRALVLRYVAAGTLWLGNSRMAYEDVGCPVGGRLTGAHFPSTGRAERR
jgi:hypothetical protein